MSNIYTSVLSASGWSRAEHCAAQLEECWEYAFGERLVAWGCHLVQLCSFRVCGLLPSVYVCIFMLIMIQNLNLGNICLVYTVCCVMASGTTEAMIKSGFLLSPHLGLYRYSKATLPLSPC